MDFLLWRTKKSRQWKSNGLVLQLINYAPPAWICLTCAPQCDAIRPSPRLEPFPTGAVVNIPRTLAPHVGNGM